jgi:hypothetical protein
MDNFTKDSETFTLAIATVNGVYFPGQRLQFKIKDPSRRLNLNSDKRFGIVSRKGREGQTTGRDDHFEFGTIVKIVDSK